MMPRIIIVIGHSFYSLRPLLTTIDHRMKCMLVNNKLWALYAGKDLTVKSIGHGCLNLEQGLMVSSNRNDTAQPRRGAGRSQRTLYLSCQTYKIGSTKGQALLEFALVA